MAKKRESPLDEQSLRLVAALEKTIAVGKRGCPVCRKTTRFVRATAVQRKTVVRQGALGQVSVSSIREPMMLPMVRCSVCDHGRWEGGSLEDQLRAAQEAEMREETRKRLGVAPDAQEQNAGFLQRPSGLVVPTI